MMYPASQRSKQLTMEDDFTIMRKPKHNETLDQKDNSWNWFKLEHDGWHLPATKEAHTWCGSWAYRGCLNVSGHAHAEGFKGKGFLKTFQKSCYRADCELCWEKWLARESNKSTRRIETYESQAQDKVKHIIISVPHWLHYQSKKELSKTARTILKDLGCVGGAMVFHPFRKKLIAERWEWYYSPHFHILGFGWINDTAENYRKNGWIVKNKGTRESTFATFWYQLSHAGIRSHSHALTWFGDLSYSKLKVPDNENEEDLCPYCNEKIRELFCNDNFWKPPDIECEIAVDVSHWSYGRVGSSEPYFNAECKEASDKANDLLKLLN